MMMGVSGTPTHSGYKNSKGERLIPYLFWHETLHLYLTEPPNRKYNRPASCLASHGQRRWQDRAGLRASLMIQGLPLPGASQRRKGLSRDSQSDLELIAAINSGDEGSFEVLYRRYREWVVRLAYRFTGNEDLALDVLQETFLYFLQKFPGFVLT